MPKFSVYAIVRGSKYLGEFEAENAEAAVADALNSDAAYISLCHSCKCEDPECVWSGCRTGCQTTFC